MYKLIKNVCLGLGVGTSMVLASCQAPEPTSSITVNWEQVNQTIDGFGVAEADWADDVFVFPKREQVLDALFGKDGLGVNILRGEIFPHYSNGPKHLDFAVQSDTSMNVVKNAATLQKNDLLRRGQYWLTSRVQQKYPDVLFTFSVWSPPAWMKQDSHATPDYPASQGSLKREHYQDFADYLVKFYKAYESVGVKTYAISASNEPGYAAPWNSCEWTWKEMGDFVHQYMLPTFEKEQVPAKVIFGENPAWSTVFDKLHMISSADFCNDILKNYPLDTKRVIAAGHGYVLPDTLPLPADLRRTPIIPFVEAEKRNVPMWVTEISDITPLDISMKDGLYWADMFQKYLMDAHVSALVWWCGAMPTKTNESLIVLDRETGNYTLSKRYDAFGNYTRYIPKGSQGVANQLAGMPEGVCVSTFKKGNDYTVVVVNPTQEQVACSLNLDGVQLGGDLKSYTTTAHKRWEEGTVSLRNGKYVLNLEPESIITYTGHIN